MANIRTVLRAAIDLQLVHLRSATGGTAGGRGTKIGTRGTHVPAGDYPGVRLSRRKIIPA
ncbi:MAG: hypothetical protein WD491_06800 [Balneolales bacterium]